MSTLIQASKIPSYEQELAVQQFFSFLQDDVKNATSYRLKESGSVIKLDLIDGFVTTIEKYDNLIRRRVNGAGHEIYLRNIKKLQFAPAEHGFTIIVILGEGEIYEKNIIWYNQ